MTPDPIQQRTFALEIVTRLRQSGYQAYWAGGCVRDQLLNHTPKDYDVATNALPEQIRDLFGKRRTLAIGAAFGVIAVVGSPAQGTVEVATFRRDTTYSDGRRPDSVVFSTPEEDAQRRDFTINGLFFDPLADRVLDFVGGVNDLQQGIVRAIGIPKERFSEDKLRLLRAVRMAARFGFEIDPPTLAAVRQLAPQVVVVSPERIGQEMRQMLVIAARSRALRLLANSEQLEPVWPELFDVVRQHVDLAPSAWVDTLNVLDELISPSVPLALAASLLHVDAGRAAVAAVTQRWRLSNHESQATAWLLQHARALDDAPATRWSIIQRLLIAPGAADLIELHAARARAEHRSLAAVDYCRARLGWPTEQLNPPPLVTGHDLIGLGVSKGPVFARWLDQLRSAQLDGEINSHEAALALVQQWKRQTTAS